LKCFSCRCPKTAPMAKSLASHISSNGRSQFGAIKIGASKMSHRSRDFGKILNQSPVKTGVTEETSNTFDRCGMKKFSNDIDFRFVDLNPVFGNLMADDNALFDHKVAFLPV
nr:hypothetical protein [Tanacetum cinerariifolium]